MGTAESQIARTSQGGLSLQPKQRLTSPEDTRPKGWADKAGRQIMDKRGSTGLISTNARDWQEGKSPDATPGGGLGLWSSGRPEGATILWRGRGGVRWTTARSTEIHNKNSPSSPVLQADSTISGSFLC